MLNISSLTNDYLSKVKTYTPSTLFPPEWSALSQSRCPLCNHKLYFPKNGKVALCKKNHFAIKIDTFKEIVK